MVLNGSGKVDAANVTDVTVQCENVGRFAYVANAGNNTVSAYSIDSMTGALTAVGTAVATGLSPYAIVARPDGAYVYVGNQVVQ